MKSENDWGKRFISNILFLFSPSFACNWSRKSRRVGESELRGKVLACTYSSRDHRVSCAANSRPDNRATANVLGAERQQRSGLILIFCAESL